MNGDQIGGNIVNLERPTGLVPKIHFPISSLLRLQDLRVARLARRGLRSDYGGGRY